MARKTARPKIFITQPVAASALTRLRKVATVEMNADDTRILGKAALRAGVSRNDILFCLLHDRIDRVVIAANPKLKHIASQSISPSNVDVAEATMRRATARIRPNVRSAVASPTMGGITVTGMRRRVASATSL